MTKQTINEIRFDELNKDALSFYQKNGWVVLREKIKPAEIAATRKSWGRMVGQYASDIGVDSEQYLEVISQWRDLWKHDPQFKHLLTALSPLAAASFELPGARLLHDHFICKIGDGANGDVPWHQDSMYWPVDRTGLSTWFAIQDTPVEHGCLEVGDGSNHWNISPPIDFMDATLSFSYDKPTSLLPVRAGDVVLLDSRTWHRSAPTQHKNQIRIAHIALWIPEQTRYWPDNAAWHPVNKQVSVAKGELLNEDEFPVFGKRSSTAGSSAENKYKGVTQRGGMFDSKSSTESQVQTMLNKRDSLYDMLRLPSNRTKIIDVLNDTTPFDRERITQCVKKLWVSVAANEMHRSRNVFCTVYLDWKDMYFFHELSEFISIKSLDGMPDENLKALEFIRQRLEPAGFDCHVIGTEDTDQPALVAYRPEISSNKKIVLYGHYDVAPVAEHTPWETKNPFQLEIKGGRIYGRGIADNKGTLFSRIEAVVELVKKQTNMPAILWLIQGEEEILNGKRIAKDIFADQLSAFDCNVVVEETGFNDIETGEAIGFVWSRDEHHPELDRYKKLIAKSTLIERIEFRHLQKINGMKACPLLSNLSSRMIYLGFGPNDRLHQIHRENESLDLQRLISHKADFSNFIRHYATS